MACYEWCNKTRRSSEIRWLAEVIYVTGHWLPACIIWSHIMTTICPSNCQTACTLWIVFTTARWQHIQKGTSPIRWAFNLFHWNDNAVRDIETNDETTGVKSVFFDGRVQLRFYFSQWLRNRLDGFVVWKTGKPSSHGNCINIKHTEEYM